MAIRQATLNDIDTVTELFNLYRIFYKQHPDLESASGFIVERLTNKDSIIFVAEDEEGNGMGFLQLYPTFSSVKMKKMWVLNDLYVKENARGKGFGEKLVKEAIAFAKETNACGLLLETASHNKTAQKLYEKIGFLKETTYFYFYTI